VPRRCSLLDPIVRPFPLTGSVCPPAAARPTTSCVWAGTARSTSAIGCGAFSPSTGRTSGWPGRAECSRQRSTPTFSTTTTRTSAIRDGSCVSLRKRAPGGTVVCLPGGGCVRLNETVKAALALDTSGTVGLLPPPSACNSHPARRLPLPPTKFLAARPLPRATLSACWRVLRAPHPTFGCGHLLARVAVERWTSLRLGVAGSSARRCQPICCLSRPARQKPALTAQHTSPRGARTCGNHRCVYCQQTS
jgi:hypothetical protein